MYTPLSLRQVEYFVKVAKHGSISADCAELRNLAVLSACSVSGQQLHGRRISSPEQQVVSLWPPLKT
ncbi:hypothetical protein NKJ72_29700, partial [Mesorhizobium sp. M0045]|uniref:hypothetical protein n=1 Tax=Mesorhizobium sp. M0045 TaxID=2956857 RepID=UPI003335F5A4